MTALTDDQIEQVINRIATRLEAYGPTQPSWMLHRTIASIMRGCQHAEPWAEGRTDCGCPRQSIKGIADTVKLGFQLPAYPQSGSADYDSDGWGLRPRPVEIHIDGKAISRDFTPSRVTPSRYSQCDQTCTADCGHCKGQGPPPEPPGPVDAPEPPQPIDDRPYEALVELAHRLDEENLELRQQAGRMTEDAERLTAERDHLADLLDQSRRTHVRALGQVSRLRTELAEARRNHSVAVDELTRLIDALKGTRNA